MIEGCIVAKLVLGYLSDEGFHKTCSAFQEECSLFENGTNKLDQVFLTSDLKTILEDYSQLIVTGRENGKPTGTAVLKSLWKDLDTVIGRLKYATIPTVAPKTNMGSQATRTRHLNSGRSRIISLQKFKDNPSKTAPVPSIMKPSLNENTVLQKLPLPRYSTVGTLQNHSSLQSSCINRTLLSTTCSGGNKDLTGCQTSNSRQSSGCSFPAVNPLMIPCTSQVTITPNSLAPSHNFNKHINKEQSSTYSVCDLTNSSALCSDSDFSHSAGEHSSSQTAPNLIIVNNEARREYHEAPTVLEQCSSLDSGQNDLARSPKRKGAQPKKRVCQDVSGMSAVADSPVKSVPQSVNQNVATDITCTPDTLTPQSFLGTLLNTPLLQEKMAENINKIVSSTRTQTPNDDSPSILDSTQSMTTTEASSEDVPLATNQGCGGDIPVKEIMDLMQADPAFDVLFSCFGLDALDALPCATDPNAEQLPIIPVNASLASEKSLSSQLTSELNPQGPPNSHLDTPNSVPDVSNGNSSLQASNQQLHLANSSSSNLHLSATNIVTDALLLLAGSPPKKTPTKSAPTEPGYSTNIPVSEQFVSDTPPKKAEVSPNRYLIGEKLPCRQSLVNQPALITSTLPYVRALNFASEKETVPKKRGPKKGSRKKNNTKQFAKINEQNKSSGSKSGGNNNSKQAVAKKSSEQTALTTSACTATSNVNITPPHTNSTRSIVRANFPYLVPADVTVTSACYSASPHFVVTNSPDSSPVGFNIAGSSLPPVTCAHGVSHSPVFSSNHVTMVTTTALDPFNFNGTSTCPTTEAVNSTSMSKSPSTTGPFSRHDLSPTFSPTLGTPCPLSAADNTSLCQARLGVANSNNFVTSSASTVPPTLPTISCATPTDPVVNSLSTSTGVSEAPSCHQFTDPIVVSATSNTKDPTSSQVDEIVTRKSGCDHSGESFTFQASNLLQTLAKKASNSSDLQNEASGLTDQVNTERQPSKENSTSFGNTTVCKDNITFCNKNREANDSSRGNLTGQESKSVAKSLQNSQENKNNNTTTSLACSDLLKRSSLNLSHSREKSDNKLQGTSYPEQKKRRLEVHSTKEKKSKSSRPSKRSKTSKEGMNFPMDLNVEEFLAKLHYEEQ